MKAIDWFILNDTDADEILQGILFPCSKCGGRILRESEMSFQDGQIVHRNPSCCLLASMLASLTDDIEENVYDPIP